MDRNDLKPGMLLRISAGKGTYKTDKYAAILRIVSVNHSGKKSDQKVIGFQYQIIAQRGEKYEVNFLQYQKHRKILPILSGYISWWETFNPKLLV